MIADLTGQVDPALENSPDVSWLGQVLKASGMGY